MSTIVTRAGKGSALTHTEVDANFTNLNTDKLQSGNTAAALTITSATINGGAINSTTIGATTPNTGAFTTLTTSDNVTLGDASTDTVTVNGYMGVGGAGSSGRAIQIVSTGLVGAAQEGIRSQITGSSSATSDIRSFISVPATAATAFTATEVVGYFAANATLGAGSTITNQHGLYIADQTRGTNNYGITSLVSSGSNKWNIYASGTAQNYFAGNVGIGIAPSFAKLDVSFSDATAYSASNMAAGLGTYIYNSSVTDSTSSTLFFGTNGTSSDAQGAISLVHTGTGAGALAFGTRNTGNVIERMRIDSSGNVLIGVTSANANGGILQLSQGITFPATQVAATDANTLDDYEEGTFTPTIVGTTVAGTGTYAANGQVGRYTKIGNRVYFNIWLNWTAHTGTGNMRVSGLPFTSNATAGNLHSYSVSPSNITLTAANYLVGYTSTSSTQVQLEQVPTGGGTSAVVPIDTAASLIVSGHYEV